MGYFRRAMSFYFFSSLAFFLVVFFLQANNLHLKTSKKIKSEMELYNFYHFSCKLGMKFAGEFKLMLLDYFPFLPSEVFAAAFSTFNRCRGVSSTTFSADFNVKPTLLSQSFFKRVHYWHFTSTHMMLLQ